MKKINSLLLVDDNVAINRLNQILIEDLAVAESVYTAENGQVALNMIKSGQICPDVIITDLHMPVMDGVAFLTAYHQLSICQKKANIFLCSDTDCSAELAQIATLNIVEEQLEKPISADTWQRLQSIYGQ
ncbi:MAG: response regulator [Bacteroidota bacterium]